MQRNFLHTKYQVIARASNSYLVIARFCIRSLVIARLVYLLLTLVIDFAYGPIVQTVLYIKKLICMCVGALSKWLRKRKALPISEKPKLTWLEFRYFGIIPKLALLEFRYFGIILKLAWLEFRYFGIQNITENNFGISVYRYSNIDIPNLVIFN